MSTSVSLWRLGWKVPRDPDEGGGAEVVPPRGEVKGWGRGRRGETANIYIHVHIHREVQSCVFPFVGVLITTNML